MILLAASLDKNEPLAFETEFEPSSSLVKIYFTDEDYKESRRNNKFKEINNKFTFFVNKPAKSYISGIENLRLSENSQDPIIHSLKSLIEVAIRLNTGVFFKKVGEYYDPSPWRKFVNLLGRK